MLQSLIYPFKVGAVNCTVLFGGQSEIEDLPARFTNWDLPGNELSQAINSNNVLLVDIPHRRLMVDAGSDHQYLLAALARMNMRPHDIHTILITHMHDAHIGGLIDDNKQPVFPHARYIMWHMEWDYWTAERTLDICEPERQETILNIVNLISPNLVLLRNHDSITDEISPVWLPGHTPGHMGLMIESQGEQFLHLADTVHYLPQLPYLHWNIKSDVGPTQAIITRREILHRVAHKGTLTLSYHFPFPGLGYFEEVDRAFEWHPLDE